MVASRCFSVDSFTRTLHNLVLLPSDLFFLTLIPRPVRDYELNILFSQTRFSHMNRLIFL